MARGVRSPGSAARAIWVGELFPRSAALASSPEELPLWLTDPTQRNVLKAPTAKRRERTLTGSLTPPSRAEQATIMLAASSRRVSRSLSASCLARQTLRHRLRVESARRLPHQQRRHITDRLFPNRKLRRLEEDANRNTGDDRKQLTFMQELNRQHPEFVVRRYEAGGFAKNEAVVK